MLARCVAVVHNRCGALLGTLHSFTIETFMKSIFKATVLAVAVFGAAVALGADDVAFERVIGPEFPGKYKHPASIEELASGDLYIAYYGGDGEYAPATAVYGMRKKKGEQAWSQPAIIADTPFRSDGNAVIWQAPDGLVWLFYVCRFGDTWSTSRIKAKISHDDGHTWSDSFLVALEEGMMVRGRPIVLEDGSYLLPVYRETGHDTEIVGPESTSLFLRFDPRTEKWSESSRIKSAARQHSACGGPRGRRAASGLLPARRGLWPGERGLHRALGIARRRTDLERGAGHEVSEPQRGRRFS